MAANSASTALFTDHYELTMVEAALHSAAAERWSVFEVFARSLPGERRYGVVGGIQRVLDALAGFRFGQAELDFLATNQIVTESTLEWLRNYRFTGHIDAYREGELYFPGSPVITITAPFAQGVLLETLVLSILNHDSAVATAAARMVSAAAGRPLAEMGSRRTHEGAAVAAARTAVLCGFAWTSNLEAGRRYGVKTAGTAAHAYTLAHDSELEAFKAQVESLGTGTTLLVDTYDIPQGIRNALEAAGLELGAVRIDSGDLAVESAMARRQLDEAGATKTRITVSGDLDEHSLEQLTGTPIDAFGLGTRLVTGSGVPTVGFVYKLVARGDDGALLGPQVPVAKKSSNKASHGARKFAWRLLGTDGKAAGEVLYPGEDWRPDTPARPLQVAAVRHGDIVHRPSNEEILNHHRMAVAELPEGALALSPGVPALEVVLPTPRAVRYPEGVV